MKTLHFNHPNDLSWLHDQLLTAIPGLQRVAVNARGQLTELLDNLHVEGQGDDIWLTVPDGADEAAIAAVVQAHDPTVPRPVPIDPDLAAFDAATTIAGVKQVLRRRLFGVP